MGTIQTQKVWKVVPGFSDYEVSINGELRKELKESSKKVLKRDYRYMEGSIGSEGYKVTSIFNDEGVKKNMKLHTLVAMAFLGYKPDGTTKIVCDHINNIKTDNRLSNLQLIGNRENSSKDKKGGSSKFTGVNWDKRLSKWRAQISVNGKKEHLGLFKYELEAAGAYLNRLNELEPFHLKF